MCDCVLCAWLFRGLLYMLYANDVLGRRREAGGCRVLAFFLLRNTFSQSPLMFFAPYVCPVNARNYSIPLAHVLYLPYGIYCGLVLVLTGSFYGQSSAMLSYLTLGDF